MNLREHLARMADAVVWWEKNGKIKVENNNRDVVKQDIIKINSVFMGRNMHMEYPSHVLYVCYHGPETTCYLLDGDGKMVRRGVLLRHPEDALNMWALWAQVVSTMMPSYSGFRKFLLGLNSVDEGSPIEPGYFDEPTWPTNHRYRATSVISGNPFTVGEVVTFDFDLCKSVEEG